MLATTASEVTNETIPTAASPERIAIRCSTRAARPRPRPKRAMVLCMNKPPKKASSTVGSLLAQQARENTLAVLSAVGRLDEVFRVGHHAHDVAPGIGDAGDIVDRTVGVCLGRVAEDHLAVVLDGFEGVGFGEIIAVVMGDGAAD